MHEGRIDAESLGEGQGAKFTVQIPLVSPPVPIVAFEQIAASATDLSGIQILVVDDEIDSRDFVAFVLEQAGAIVTRVSSGSEALQELEQFVPNLIISDIGMPEMDGYMLLQRIRELESVKQVPAIALTAYAGELDRQQAIAVGFQKHMSKPIDLDQLVSAVSSLCKIANRSAP
jgi:CheY-like chemotaxis protein